MKLKTNYALAALRGIEEGPSELLHICLYEKKPTQECVDSLVEELKNDPEFKMQDLTIDQDYRLVEMSGEKFIEIKQEMGIPDELNDEEEMENTKPEEFKAAKIEELIKLSREPYLDESFHPLIKVTALISIEARQDLKALGITEEQSVDIIVEKFRNFLLA